MVGLAVACLAGGLSAPICLGLVAPPVGVVAGLTPGQVQALLGRVAGWLVPITIAALILIGLSLLLVLLRWWLLSGRSVHGSVTWDCGYARPTARMQYTGSSFAQPLTTLFGVLMPTRLSGRDPDGVFPGRADFSTETPDVFQERFYVPLFRGIQRVLATLRWLQQGKVQFYILYIAVTLLVLLALVAWRIR